MDSRKPSQALPSPNPCRLRPSIHQLLFYVLSLSAVLGLTWRAPAQEQEQGPVTVSLAWDPSSSTNVVGYSVLYGPASNRYQSRAWTDTNTMVTITNLAPGTFYFFVVTALSEDGIESDPSNEVSTQTPGQPPNMPPTLDPIANVKLAVGSRPRVVRLTGVGPGAPWEDQAVIVRAVSSNPRVIPDPIVQFDPSYDSGTLTLQPLPEATGTATITVNVNDGATVSNSFSRNFRVTVGTNLFTTLFLEAESGIVSAPMTLGFNLQASGTSYISSAVNSAGSATYTIDIRQEDAYTVWCRVVSANSGTDSFFVSVDGKDEDVFDTGLDVYSSTWQWTRLNGRTLGTPRLPELAVGRHSLTFRGREPGTFLDAIYVTNDPDFVPVKLAIAPLASRNNSVELSFRSPAGYRYGLEASQDFKSWTNLWDSTVAGPNQRFSFVDSTTTAGGRRFYRLIVK